MWKSTTILNYGKQDDIFRGELMKVIHTRFMDDKLTITYENNQVGEFIITLERRTFLPDYKFPFLAFAGIQPKLSAEVIEIKE